MNRGVVLSVRNNYWGFYESDGGDVYDNRQIKLTQINFLAELIGRCIRLYKLITSARRNFMRMRNVW